MRVTVWRMVRPLRDGIGVEGMPSGSDVRSAVPARWARCSPRHIFAVRVGRPA